MEILKTQNGSNLDLSVIGRLDMTTAPKLDTVILNELDGVTELLLNFEKLEYISSAGLRVLLAAQKKMNKQGSMVIRNVNSDIQEIFEITGFADIFTIE